MKTASQRKWLAVGFAAWLAASGAVLGWMAATLFFSVRVMKPALAEPMRAPQPPRLRQSMPDDIAGWVHAVHAAGVPSAQMLAAAELGAWVRPEDFARLLEHGRFLPSHTAQEVLVRTVLRRWIAGDPEAALNWCFAHQRDLVAEAMKEWAKRDAEAAENFAAGVPGQQREMALGAVFSVLARTDSESAFVFLRSHASSKGGEFLREGLRQLAKRDAAGVIEAADSLPGNARRLARQVAAEAWARQDFASAFAWAKEQPDQRALLGNVFTKGQGASQVLPALSSLSDNQQQEILNNRGYEWGQKNPEEWLEAVKSAADLPLKIRNQLVNRLARHLVRVDPEGAVAKLSAAFPDQRLWMEPLVTTWASMDSKAARRWAESLGDAALREKWLSSIDAADKSKAAVVSAVPIERLTAELKANNNIEAGQLLELSTDERVSFWQQVEETPDAYGHGHSSLKEIMVDNFPAEAARALASQTKDDPKRGEIVSRVAANWASQDPAAAARWVATLPAGDERSSAASNVARQWHRLDAREARFWVDSLPEADREAATKILERQ